MNSQPDLSFDYSSSYFQSGMDGWHAASYLLITEKFERFAKGRRFPAGLDFGCGDGFYGPFLRQHVDRLFGADLSNCIEDARNRAAYHDFIQRDLGKRIIGKEDTYDIIFSSEVIEHVSDYRAFMENAYHLLKPGGYFFLTTTTFACGLPLYLAQHPKQWSIPALIQFVKGFFGDEFARTTFLKNLWSWTKGHHHGFSKRQLREALGKVGFEIETLEYLHAQPFVYTNFFWNPFKRTKNRWLIIPVARVLGGLGSIANFLCKEFDIYAPNVFVIARKPDPRSGCV